MVNWVSEIKRRRLPYKFVICPETNLKSDSVISISCGEYHTMALMKNRKLYSWGRNDHGQLGLNNMINYFTPQEIVWKESIKSITCGYDYNVAITLMNKIYVWGENTYSYQINWANNYTDPDDFRDEGDLYVPTELALK